MSVLDNPRIAFGGEISWDPIVTNNYRTNYNEGTGDIVPSQDTADQFRAKAVSEVTGRGSNWNPHGTHRSVFFNTTIKSVDIGAGPTAADPFAGVPVAFSGMLVDLEPYGSNTSQLFFDEMSFGIAGGCRILAKRAFRFNDRYINFGRNPSNGMTAGPAGVGWQTCFPKENITLDAFDSPALQAFTAALNGPGVLGLMVRWQSYRTVYFDQLELGNGDNDLVDAAFQELKAKLDAGGWQPNPARSLLVGVIGLWHESDAIHEPGDRAILPVGVSLSSDSANYGPAFAKLGESSLTLDLGGFVPESDLKADKHDVGTLSVVAVDPNNDSTVLATLGSISYSQYNKQAYDLTAGIVTLSNIPAEVITTAKTADLQILDGTGQIIATEVALQAIPSDPNLYLDQGASTPSKVRVYNRGVPVGQGVNVNLSEDGGTSVVSTQTTDANGYVGFQFSGQTPGVVQYVLSLGTDVPTPANPASLNPSQSTFISVRVLPTDAEIGEMEPTWENVYNQVLINWYAMAPCMDNWLLLNDPDMVKKYGPIVKRLTAVENFESFRYMPVTRDLSAGKRKLLYKYLDAANHTPAALLASSNVIQVKPSRHVRSLQLPSKTMPQTNAG